MTVSLALLANHKSMFTKNPVIFLRSWLGNQIYIGKFKQFTVKQTCFTSCDMFMVNTLYTMKVVAYTSSLQK